MICPHCQSQLLSATPHCPQCGFCLGKANEVYGDFAVELEPVLTYEDFPVEEKQRIHELVVAWREDFPQLFLSVYLGPEPKGPGLRAFSLWLINQGQAKVGEVVWDNQFTILLLVEPVQREAVVTLGYSVEQWLGQEGAEVALAAAQPAFAEEDWLSGIAAFLHRLSTELAARATTEPLAHPA